jgi:hypothetical protein
MGIFDKWTLDQTEADIIKAEGLQTFTGASNLIQTGFTKASANPWAVVAMIFILGMVFNKQGGLKLGKNFEVKV